VLKTLTSTQTPWGLYIHWPFCATKCPYCDFNSHVRGSVDQAAWRAALVKEIESAAERAGHPTLKSIFFGGGTPSLMPPDTVAAAIEAAHAHFSVQQDIEVSLEANPSSVEAKTFPALADAGVNRFSLGIQSFDDAVLKFLGRPHTASEAGAAIDAAQKAVARVSFDLIYALPEHTPAQWMEQLDMALSFGTAHLSAYQLTIEPNTGFFGQVARGVFTPLDDDLAADLYDLTQERLSAAGLARYETSNHAASDAQCQHNLIYWRGQPYAAVGPGAHGRWMDADSAWTATQNIKKPEHWLTQMDKAGQAIEQTTRVGPKDRAEEIIMTSLRLAEGLDMEAASLLSGYDVWQLIDQAAAQHLAQNGWIVMDGNVLRLSENAQPVANHIVQQLLA